MTEENQKTFGKLFQTIDLQSEEHLNTILENMSKDNAFFIMVQAIKFAYRSGIYSMGEVEVLSKCIRVLSTEEKTES